MADCSTRRILLGHITGAHGIRGAVVIKTYTEIPEDIDAYGALEDEAGQRCFALKVQSVTAKGVLAIIDGVDDRTAAEQLKGVGLYVPRDRLPALEDGGYYHADLIGLAAVASDGRVLGHVVDVQNYGAGDILEIRFSGRRRTELLPVTNSVVPEIDVAGGRVMIEVPDSIEVLDGDADQSSEHDKD